MGGGEGSVYVQRASNWTCEGGGEDQSTVARVGRSSSVGEASPLERTRGVSQSTTGPINPPPPSGVQGALREPGEEEWQKGKLTPLDPLLVHDPAPALAAPDRLPRLDRVARSAV